MYFFPVPPWLPSDVLFENTNITRASVPSDHLSLRKVNAIYIYIYRKVFSHLFLRYIYSNLFPTRKMIFSFREHEYSLSTKKQKEKEKRFFSTRVSLNDRSIFFSSFLHSQCKDDECKDLCNEREREKPFCPR